MKKKSAYINEERNNKIAELEKQYETKENWIRINNLEIFNLRKKRLIEQQQFNLKKRMYIIWIFILISLSLMLLFYFYYTSEKKRTAERKRIIVQETEKRERERISKDLHDEIGAGLSKIILITELSTHEINNKSKLLKNLTTMSDSALKTSDNIRDLIWIMNTEELTLDKMAIRLRNNMEDYIESTGIKLIIDFEAAKNKITKIDKRVGRHLSFIVKELLQNCIKHSKASEIKTTLSYTNGFINLNFYDNGIGFDVKARSDGNGLSNIFYRVSQMGGNMDVFSSPNGSSFKIQIPNTI